MNLDRSLAHCRSRRPEAHPLRSPESSHLGWSTGGINDLDQVCRSDSIDVVVANGVLKRVKIAAMPGWCVESWQEGCHGNRLPTGKPMRRARSSSWSFNLS